MTNTVSAFEQINSTNTLLLKVTSYTREYIEVLKSEQNKLNHLWKEMNEKQLLLIASQSPTLMDQLINICDEYYSISFDSERLSKYHNKQYSKFNIMFLLRRFMKAKEASEDIVHNQQRRLRGLLSELKKKEEQISKLQYGSIDNLLSQIEDCRSAIVSCLEINLTSFDVIHYIQSLFVEGSTITKSELLSLISVDKSGYAKEYIDSLAENGIDYRELEEAIFVHKIEDPDDEWLFNIFFDQFWKFREENKEAFAEMEEKLFDDIGFNQIPTYNVSFDEWGEPVEVKRNPPNLKRIK